MRFIRSMWLRLLGVAALSIILAACGAAQGGAVPTSAPPGGANGSGTTVDVVAAEYAFALGAAQAKAGTITLVVTNTVRPRMISRSTAMASSKRPI